VGYPGRPPPLPKRPLDRILYIFATGFGAGYSPFASGTVGTAVAIPFGVGIQFLPWPWQLAALVALTALAIWAAGSAARHLQNKDPKQVVSDEIAGYAVTVALLPPSVGVAVAGFFLFRLFDIWKPWPASYFDRQQSGGFSIVMDDIVAGLYARLVLEVLRQAVGWP
jgi:phosphatidylglycerophosphatase A